MRNAIELREATVADAPILVAFAHKNREYLTPFEPVRPADWWDVDQVSKRLGALRIGEAATRTTYNWIIELGEEIVGQIVLSNISRGPFQSANLGYSVDKDFNGRGIATDAVSLVVDEAFGCLNLHRIEAGTLTDNVASQRVLEKNGFVRIGVSPFYLQIAGEWRDHALYALTQEARR